MAKNVDPLVFQLFEMTPRKGDLRKVAIIKAAIDCIAINGIENLSLETVGKRLGIGRAHVGYYFKTIPEIIDLVIQYIMANAQKITVEKVTAARTPEQMIEAMAEAAFEWAHDFPEQASVYMLFFYYCAKDADKREFQKTIRETGAARIEAILEKIGNKGKKLQKARAERLAKNIQFLITGGVVELITTSAKQDRREAMARWKAHVLAGIEQLLA